MTYYKRQWTPLPYSFKRHRGKTIPQIAFCDPGYVCWLVKRNDLSGPIAQEIQEVYRKMQGLRIRPLASTETYVVEYFAYWEDGKFAKAEVIPQIQGQHEGGSRTIIKPVWDLLVPYHMAGCRRHQWGNERLLRAVKKNLFGDSNYRMTSKRAQQFFADDSNF